MSVVSDLLPRRDPLKPRGGPPRKSTKSRWRALALIGVHVAILVHVAHWQIAGETVTPVEPSEAMATLELGYVNAGFILFAALILLTLVLGRFFCGWACHVVAYQDLCAWALGKLGLKPRPVRSRVLVALPFLAAFYMFALPTIERWSRGEAAPEWQLHLTTDGYWDTFPGWWIGALTFLVDGFLLVWWLGAKGFCTYGCPYGAVFGVADRLATARIRVTDACETCGHCTATCTSNVRVHEEVAKHKMVVDPACMKCMDCVSVCPKDALYVGFGKPALAATSGQRKKGRADFTWGEEAVLAAVAIGAVLAFRSLYSAVPVMLALGLGALTAIAAITLLRLLRRRDFGVQHVTLRVGGTWRRAGVAALVLLGGWLAFAAHSGWVRYHAWQGERLANAAVAPSLSTAEKDALLAESQSLLETADRDGLFADPRVPKNLGLVLRERGAFTDAEARLREALELQPLWPAAAVPLSDLLAIRRAWTEAGDLLRAVEAEHGPLPPVRQRLDRLERIAPR